MVGCGRMPETLGEVKSEYFTVDDSIKKLPEEQQNAETRAMLETYGKQVDFVDFSTLENIIENINQ